jgi:VanZ family protein
MDDVTQRRHRGHWLHALALVSATIVVVVAVLLPSSALSSLRSGYPWFSHAISWVEHLWPAVDMVHVVLFAVVGLFGRLAFPRQSLRVRVLWLLVFAAGSELVQFMVPGREPRWSDLVMDFGGGLVGFLVAVVLMRIARAVFPRRAGLAEECTGGGGCKGLSC